VGSGGHEILKAALQSVTFSDAKQQEATIATVGQKRELA